MKYMLFIVSTLLLMSCGNSSGGKKKPNVLSTPELIIDEAISNMEYPGTGLLTYQGELIADLSSLSATVSSLGSVIRGQTLNYLTVDGTEILVYGEDGVFATECEPNASYPDHGPSHPKCEVAHAESYDTIIVCKSTLLSTPLALAQNWPGYPAAMTDTSLGMECWVNGQKMKSNKVFTY